MRYPKPCQSERHAYSDRFDVFSPKLGRPLVLFSYLQVRQWLLLEAFPWVNAFCERPDFLEVKDRNPVLIDFWIQGKNTEFFLVSRDEGSPELNLISPPSLRIRYLRPSQLDSSVTLTQNWQSMLPYIVSYRHWLTNDHTADIVKLCAGSITLGELEDSLANQETSWVRACVFDALAKGSLQAPSLKSRPWDRFLQLSPRRQHAD